MSLRITLLLLLFLIFAACSPTGFRINKGGDFSEFLEVGAPDLIPETDRLDNACFSKAEYDGCIFLKSPVAQQGSSVSLPALNDFRRFGFKLRGVGASGFLENSKFQVLTVSSTRLNVSQRSLFKSPIATDQSYAEQMSAYYWADRATQYLRARVGDGRLPVRALKIFADDAFTGYSAQRNTIHLEKSVGMIAHAFSADVVVQLFGQAIAQGLSNQKLLTSQVGSEHVSCQLNPKGCCKTNLGCPAALVSGFGDYVVAVLNPALPRLGETVSGRMMGQNICGLDRDLKTLHSNSRASVHSACGSAAGHASLMGSWYASVWWTLRELADSQNSGASQDIDLIFFDHFKTLGSNSTFAEAKTSALWVAQNYKQGLYSTLILDHLTNAGL